MPSQAAYEAILHRHSSELHKYVSDLGAGKITPEQFGDHVYASLVRGHADAYSAGLRHAGSQLDPLVIQQQAEAFGRAQADTENGWLDKFVADLEDGRYTDEDGNLVVSTINHRANMYVLKLRATGTQGFIDASAANNPEEEFTWVMTAIEHCEDCPRMAALSPYKAHELFTMPCAGDTECLTHCRCHLVRRSDGKASFTA